MTVFRDFFVREPNWKFANKIISKTNSKIKILIRCNIRLFIKNLQKKAQIIFFLLTIDLFWSFTDESPKKCLWWDIFDKLHSFLILMKTLNLSRVKGESLPNFLWRFLTKKKIIFLLTFLWFQPFHNKSSQKWFKRKLFQRSENLIFKFFLDSLVFQNN